MVQSGRLFETVVSRSWKRELRVLERYGLAAAAVAAAVGMRWLLDPKLGSYAPYLPFFIAVIVAARFAGRGPAFMATAAGALSSWYLLLDPHHSFVLVDQGPAVRLGLFVAAGVAVSFWTGQLHKALHASRNAEWQLRRLTESTPVAIAMFDRDMRYLAVSERFRQDYGLTGNLIGRCHYDVFPEIPERWREIHRRVMSGAEAGAKEDSFVRNSGRVEWSRWEMRPWYQAEGSIGGAVLATENISLQKEADVALRQSEERFRTLFENAADGIYIASADGRYVEVNASGLKLSGYSREEFLRLRIPDFVAPSDRDRLPATIAQLESGRARASEWLFVRKDGTTFPGEVSACLLPDGSLFAILRDLTERRRLEEQFLQAQKLEGIGRLAGGVAHDFNNLLTVIGGYARMSLDELPEGHSLRDSLNEIDTAAERAAALTRQLLAFSRHQLFDTQTIVVDDVVRGFERMLRRIIGEDIELTLALDAKGCGVRIGAGRIEQTILNLAVNSRDAMPAGGKLVIETGRFEVDAEFAQGHLGAAPGPYVRLAVSDTGTGMSPEVRSHVFEPFFTTKEAGKGTGLGLSTVYGIVKQNGGSIWVYSQTGEGTSFHILLPEVQTEATAAPALALPTEISGTETILVVEDEAGLRKYLRQGLERYGYRVLEAGDGREGLDLARKNEGAVDLLLTDLVMPGMGGAELAATVSGRPGAPPALCMSGYTDRLWRFENSAIGFIQKPFTIHALLTRIRAMLAANPAVTDRETSG